MRCYCCANKFGARDNKNGFAPENQFRVFRSDLRRWFDMQNKLDNFKMAAPMKMIEKVRTNLKNQDVAFLMYFVGFLVSLICSPMHIVAWECDKIIVFTEVLTKIMKVCWTYWWHVRFWSPILTAFLWTQNLGPGQDQSWPGLRFMARARQGGWRFLARAKTDPGPGQDLHFFGTWF